MKFVHIADIHFDIPFSTLRSALQAGEERRLDQREAFKKVIRYIKDNQIPYLFIAGDLYENELVRESTIQYINNLFEEIPDTKVFIAPGNHDPYIKNSYYEKYLWSKNVIILKPGNQVFEEPEFYLHGYGFGDFHCNDSKIHEIQIKNREKINILLTHANLDGSKAGEEEYNPIPRRVLKEKGFEYIALGHIHKTNYQEENDNILYPGSLISLGFDEIGQHGMIVGEIQKNGINAEVKYEFIVLDEREFEEILVDITDKVDIETIIETINEIPENNNYKKIILTGKRSFEIDLEKIRKNIKNSRILKIKDETKLQIDLEKEQNDYTLRGLFIKEALQEMQKGEYLQEEIEKALEIGLDIFEQ